MFRKLRPYLNSTRFKTAIWYSILFLTLEVMLGVFIYLYLYNNSIRTLDYALKAQANAILRIMTEKHVDIDSFQPDSVYKTPEDFVWDIIYDVVAFNRRNTFIQITSGGKILFKTANLYDKTIEFPEKTGPSSVIEFYDNDLSDSPIRGYMQKGNNFKVIVAYPKEPINETLNSLTEIYMILAPIFLIISILGGAMISAKSLSRIDAIIKKTEEITAQNLDEKISGGEFNDEYGRLVNKMNEMIDRIKTSIEFMNRFSISAAHELKTPLTILRGEIEIALKSKKNTEEYVNVLESNLEETIRIIKIVDNLFFISKIDHALIHINKYEICLSDFLEYIVKSMRLLGMEKNMNLVLEPVQDVKISIDRELMMQAFSNLIDNAFKYGNENSDVIIKTVKPDNEHVKISISNKGEGIPEESISKIFDRFYRVESSRNRKTGGVGLGLSVVKSIVTMHNGELEVKSIYNDITTFSIILQTA